MRGRVGAHRVVARPRNAWRFVIAGVVGFLLLTGLGIFTVERIGANLGLDERIGGSSETAQIEPELDPEASVAVLNGTDTPYLAEGVGQVIGDGDLGVIVFAGNAAEDDVSISGVFYEDEADIPAAEGLARELGGLSIYQSNGYASYGARLVVLLGTDYGGPGADEATELEQSTSENTIPGTESPDADAGVEADAAADATADIDGGVDASGDVPVQ
ncbi:LytR C-terminal domain-containing protein [Leucobacter tardus]|uniref:LytR C-terminal domain-containing protein n=2 Tax=Leucobacter tardus TaxID=501483 RepID=A0A939QF75_9MICO|nr:LytR C-terminal domain-containing protein [Leucobacter tardus]